MDSVRLGSLTAMSHCWHNHSESWLLVKVIKTLVNGIKAAFGGYSISALASTTFRLMKQHPEADFSQFLAKPLSSYHIDIPAIDFKNQYIQAKVEKLCQAGRNVEVQLVFDNDEVYAVPLYYSQNEPTENLNDKVKCSENKSEHLACRNFATGYAFGRGKETFSLVSCRENIEDALNANKVTTDKFLIYLIENGYAPSEAHYFPTENFVDVLETIAGKYWSMSDGEEKAFTITLSPCAGDTEESDKIQRVFKHMLSIRFKKQPGCMKVVCYEPNDTSRHFTSIIRSPAQARGLTKELLLAQQLQGMLSGCIASTQYSQSPKERDLKFYGKMKPSVLAVKEFPTLHRYHPILSRKNDSAEGG